MLVIKENKMLSKFHNALIESRLWPSLRACMLQPSKTPLICTFWPFFHKIKTSMNLNLLCNYMIVIN